MATDATDTPTNPAPISAPAKPGWTTSEFALHVVALALSAVFASGWLTNSTVLQIAGIAAAMLTAQGYAVSRTIVKTAGMLMLLVLVVNTQSACGPTARQKTIATTLAAVDVASHAFVALDNQKQTEIVAQAKDRTSGEGQLATWRSEQSKVSQLFAGAYRGIAVAATADTDVGVTGMLQVVAILSQELQALGVKL